MTCVQMNVGLLRPLRSMGQYVIIFAYGLDMFVSMICVCQQKKPLCSCCVKNQVAWKFCDQE